MTVMTSVKRTAGAAVFAGGLGLSVAFGTPTAGAQVGEVADAYHDLTAQWANSVIECHNSASCTRNSGGSGVAANGGQKAINDYFLGLLNAVTEGVYQQIKLELQTTLNDFVSGLGDDIVGLLPATFPDLPTNSPAPPGNPLGDFNVPDYGGQLDPDDSTLDADLDGTNYNDTGIDP